MPSFADRLANDFTLFSLGDPATAHPYITSIDTLITLFPRLKSIDILTDFFLARNEAFSSHFIPRLPQFLSLIYKFSKPEENPSKKDNRNSETQNNDEATAEEKAAHEQLINSLSSPPFEPITRTEDPLRSQCSSPFAHAQNSPLQRPQPLPSARDPFSLQSPLLASLLSSDSEPRPPSPSFAGASRWPDFDGDSSSYSFDEGLNDEMDGKMDEDTGEGGANCISGSANGSESTNSEDGYSILNMVEYANAIEITEDDLTDNSVEVFFVHFSRVVQAFADTCAFSAKFCSALASLAGNPPAAALIVALLQEGFMFKSFLASKSIEALAHTAPNALSTVLESLLQSSQLDIDEEEELHSQLNDSYDVLVRGFLEFGRERGYLRDLAPERPVLTVAVFKRAPPANAAVSVHDGAAQCADELPATEESLLKDSKSEKSRAQPVNGAPVEVYDFAAAYQTISTILTTNSSLSLPILDILSINRYTLFYLRLLSMIPPAAVEAIVPSLVRLLFRYKSLTHLLVSVTRILLSTSPVILDNVGFLDRLADSLYKYIALERAGRIEVSVGKVVEWTDVLASEDSISTNVGEAEGRSSVSTTPAAVSNASEEPQSLQSDAQAGASQSALGEASAQEGVHPSRFSGSEMAGSLTGSLCDGSHSVSVSSHRSGERASQMTPYRDILTSIRESGEVGGPLVPTYSSVSGCGVEIQDNVFTVNDALFAFLLKIYSRLSGFIKTRKDYWAHLDGLVEAEGALVEWRGFQRYVAVWMAGVMPWLRLFEEGALD